MRLLFIFVTYLASLLFSASTYAADFDLTSIDFLDEGALPVIYTCDGKNISPQLSWTNVPKNTKSFTLILSETDSKGAPSYHWVLYNLPGNIHDLEENIQKLPAGTMTGSNSSDKNGYVSPCPEPGSVHNYIFTLYALDKKLDLPADKDAQSVINAMRGHILQTDTLTAVYSRWPVASN